MKALKSISEIVIILFLMISGCGKKPEPGKTAAPPKTFDLGDGQIIKSVGFSSDGKRIIVGGENKRVKIVDRETGNMIWTSDPMPDAVLTAAFSPDDRFFVVTTGDNTQLTGMVAVYSSETKSEKWSVKNLQNDVQLARFSEDGKQVLVANFYNITLFETETGRQIKFFSGHPIEVASPFGHFDAVTDILFTKDLNTFISVSWDRKVLIWDITVGHDVRTYSEADPINAAILPDDERKIITGSADAIHVWNRETDRNDTIYSYDGEIRNMSRVGGYIVIGDDQGDLSVWELTTMHMISEIKKAHNRGVWCVAVSKDHRSVVSSGGDGKVTLWDIDYLVNPPKDETGKKGSNP